MEHIGGIEHEHGGVHLQREEHLDPERERLRFAVYTPTTLISTKAMGNGSANIATWQYNNTGTGESIVRSFAFSGQAGGTGAITVEIGVTGTTEEADQRIIDTYSLTANVPYFVNGWYTVPVSSFLSGFASNATTNGLAAGLKSA